MNGDSLTAFPSLVESIVLASMHERACKLNFVRKESRVLANLVMVQPGRVCQRHAFETLDERHRTSA